MTFEAPAILEQLRRLLKQALLRAMPGPNRQRLLGGVRQVRYRGNRVECPVCETSFSRFLPHRGRPEAKCPRCGALERHRLLWLFLERETDLFERRGSMLHIAPEYSLQRRLLRVEGISRTDETRLRGRSRHNKTVNFEGTGSPGEFVEVEITGATSQTLSGQERLLSRVF